MSRASTVALGAAMVACSSAATQSAPPANADATLDVPSWVFPLPSPKPRADGAPSATAPSGATPESTAAAASATAPATALVHLPDSTAEFTRAQLTNRFEAPDWYPNTHGPMPDIVSRGRPPDLYACGYCHTPGGQGRPENAPLAGLPSAYIVQQVMDFKSGARRALAPGVFPPADLMIHEAAKTSEAEAIIAAEYFTREKLRQRVTVLESSRVPRTQVVGSVYTPIVNAGDEPLGTRLIELARDSSPHENRDEQMVYVAYVPPGSVARGRALAHEGSTARSGSSGASGSSSARGTGGSSGAGAASDHRSASGSSDADSGIAKKAIACITCHGDRLQGVGPIPPLAGRSPSYLLRQLLAFKTGARTGPTAQPMQPVVATLDISGMIDAAAFAASLNP